MKTTLLFKKPIRAARQAAFWLQHVAPAVAEAECLEDGVRVRHMVGGQRKEVWFLCAPSVALEVVALFHDPASPGPAAESGGEARRDAFKKETP